MILPAAAWSENDGTFTSSERRVNRVRTVRAAPGSAMPNWWIFRELARRFGHSWESDSAREIWDNELSRLAPSMAGIKYERLEGDGLQWPVPSEESCGTTFLHHEGCFTCGLVFFLRSTGRRRRKCRTANTLRAQQGRRLYHYHTRTQTGRCAAWTTCSGGDRGHQPADAETLGIDHGEMIRVRPGGERCRSGRT